MSSFLKKAIGFVVIFILGVVAWNLFFDKKTSTDELVRSSGSDSLTDVEGVNLEDTFLDTLINLSSITLETDFWSDNVFNSLSDFTVTLIPESVGRTNPFEETTKTVKQVEAEASTISDSSQ